MPNHSISEISLGKMIRRHELTAKQVCRIFGVGLTKAYQMSDPSLNAGDDAFTAQLTALLVSPPEFAGELFASYDVAYRSRSNSLPQTPADLMHHIVNTVKRSTDGLCRTRDALADGRVDETEQLSIRSDLVELIEVARNALNCLDAAATKDRLRMAR